MKKILPILILTLMPLIINVGGASNAIDKLCFDLLELLQNP